MRYEGEWRDGKYHGQGVLTLADGRRYEGEYRDGKKNGQGVFTWPDGRRYEGAWRDSKRHGLGAQTWPNGVRYEGEWRDGKFHGQGVLTKPARVRVVEGEHTGDWSYYKGAFNEGRRWGGEYYYPKRWPMKEIGMPVDGQLNGGRVDRRSAACDSAKRAARGMGRVPYEACYCWNNSWDNARGVWQCSVEYTLLPRAEKRIEVETRVDIEARDGKIQGRSVTTMPDK